LVAGASPSAIPICLVATRSIKPGSSPSAIPLARADAIASKLGVPASYDIDDFLLRKDIDVQL